MVHPRQANHHDTNLLKGGDGTVTGGNNEDWIEKASSLSQAFHKLIAKSACKMCDVYVDEQLEFENRQEDYYNTTTGTTTTTSMARAWVKAYKPSMEVELYRQMLFDEESVVFSVSERDDNEDEEGDKTFVTHHPNDDVTVHTQRS
jgi:hypothetical protein